MEIPAEEARATAYVAAKIAQQKAIEQASKKLLAPPGPLRELADRMV